MSKVLVTGGTQGIGLAIAERFRSYGYDVATCARGENATVQCDVTDPLQVEELRAKIGPIDVLVNNAGGALSAPFLKTTEKQWDDQFQWNMKSIYYCVRVFLPDMIANRSGRIINIASTAGIAGYRYVAAYVASKHAVIGFTKALAKEVAELGVTVNAVCPSFVDTPMLRKSVEIVAEKTGKSVDELMESFRMNNPQRRFVTAEEVASTVHFLAETPAINGQAITLCGGETA